ncbi:SEL1-like repeat protein [Pseudomonas sp. R5(2019)]|uniref:SEL1-like repeat protein n=1 Tax=Pseudomonas sp. R5(2019) TaxID=2697566 RepID=UPI0014132F60|nr:SEL1-like repeat protein [Pseudomonas sp. R5(2019)]NBA94858.1 alginate biosynthesis protein [Pseudomonas sp. R5(2019)]
MNGTWRSGFQWTALAAALALVQGCGSLPDEGLARQAMARGDFQTARQNYAALAEDGYADAQAGMGDLTASAGDPASLKAAEVLYRQAAPESLKAQSRLGRLILRQGPTDPAQVREARQLLEGALAKNEFSAVVPLTLLYLSYPQLVPGVNPQQQVDAWRAQGIVEADLAQILIYRNQGTYQAHLRRIETMCQARLAVLDACYVELATIYRMRADSKAQAQLLVQLRQGWREGRVAPLRVESVARVLSTLTLEGPADAQAAQRLLEELAPVYAPAWTSLARLINDYPAQGDAPQLLTALQRGRDAGDSRAQLLTGRLYYLGKWLPQDPRQAEAHLLKAAAAGELGAHYYLGQLYRRGFLGQVEPQKALQHLLLAARSGSPSADLALARMFSEARGIKVNRVNAFVFAQLAQRQGVLEAAPVLLTLHSALTPAERKIAQPLLEGETQARLTGAALARLQTPENGQDLL